MMWHVELFAVGSSVCMHVDDVPNVCVFYHDKSIYITSHGQYIALCWQCRIIQSEKLSDNTDW